MTIDQAIAFVAFAVAAAITPGPSTIMLASIGANAGVRRGLPCLFGVVIGMGVMMGLVALGVGRLVMAWPLLFDALKWVAVGFLLWLAWKIATAGHADPARGVEIIGFWQAAAFQWVNPKSWVVTASAAGAFLVTGTGSLEQAIWLGVLFILAALPCCFVWLAFGATAQHVLQTDRALRAFNMAMAALLAGSTLLFVL